MDGKTREESLMDFKFEATLDISKAQLEEIIKSVIEQSHPNYVVKSMSFETVTAYSGYGYNESPYQVFKSVKVNLAPKG